MLMRAVGIGLVSVSLCGVASAQIFQPDSATAGSEFSSAYDIGNAIDGSGLPGGFGITDEHATYVQNNHWTTRSGALGAGNAWADFSFDTPQTIGAFYMWNHRSDGVASDPGYAITTFNLELFDDMDNPLGSLMNQSATPNVLVAQDYLFTPIDDVSRVRLTILANNGSSQYTGLAEVAFAAVPAPGTVALAAIGGLASVRRRR